MHEIAYVARRAGRTPEVLAQARERYPWTERPKLSMGSMRTFYQTESEYKQ